MTRSDRPLLAWISPGVASLAPALSSLGVSGYLSRSASAEELRSAIMEVVAGNTFVDHRLQGAMGEDEPDGLADFRLTSLQERVAILYALHGSRRRTALDLQVSENTVKYHLRSIHRMTGASCLHDLRQLLRSRGWAPGAILAAVAHARRTTR